MGKQFVARQSVTIQAAIDEVWDALTNPSKIRQYMFGTNVISDWKQGSSIVWQGEWQGRPYADKMVILRLEKPRRIEYTHFSPLSGLPDVAENYHTVSVELSDGDHGVVVSLEQDNNSTEKERDHSEKNWGMMLEGLKKVVEA